MALQIGQADIDGLVMGEGTEYRITRIRGFGMDAVRTFDRDNPASDGGYGGRDLLPIKRLGMSVTGVGVSADDLAERMVPHAADEDFQWLRYRWNGMATTRRIKVRPDMFDPKIVPGHDVATWSGEPEWRAVDPRFYADTETVENVGQAVSAGGWTFPWSFPWTFGTGGAGTIQLVNDGKANTFMVATITGPCGGPRLEHVGLGLQVNMAGLTLLTGETVVVDFGARSVLLNGTSDRYNTLTSASRFFPLQPGLNEVRFATATGSSATAELRFRSAWNVGGS
jgi:hypothetical protein